MVPGESQWIMNALINHENSKNYDFEHVASTDWVKKVGPSLVFMERCLLISRGISISKSKKCDFFCKFGMVSFVIFLCFKKHNMPL